MTDTRARGESIETAPSQEAELGSTTDTGAPAVSDRNSLTIGPDGPILLQDHYLLEQMANFNRERIPERQPHAKGGGAFGVFRVTHDVSGYTRAAVFRPGPRPRWSSGSPLWPESAAAPTPGVTRGVSR
jgi:catalase